jgi:uncharacterized membrane protein YeaQ/YmgE (transglycosylase-associated protein family)
MEILGILLFGLIAGALGKLLMPGDDPGGIIVTIVIGILGALLGSFLFDALGIGGNDSSFLIRLLGAVVGVMLLLGLYRLVTGRRSGHGRGGHGRTAGARL